MLKTKSNTKEITVKALTFTEALKKAADMGFHTICITGLHSDIKEILEEEYDDDDKAEWLLVGDVIFNVNDIGNKDAEIYILEY